MFEGCAGSRSYQLLECWTKILWSSFNFLPGIATTWNPTILFVHLKFFTSLKSMTLVTKEVISLHCWKNPRISEEKETFRQTKNLKVGKKKKEPLDWYWTIIPTQKFFPSKLPFPQDKIRAFKWHLRTSLYFSWKIPFRNLDEEIWAVKQSKLLDSERRGFPTSSQWADNLLPVITSLLCAPIGEHLLKTYSLFNSQTCFCLVWENLQQGCARYLQPHAFRLSAFPHR